MKEDIEGTVEEIFETLKNKIHEAATEMLWTSKRNKHRIPELVVEKKIGILNG